MIMAKIKLNSTPPTITSARCHAGLERNSHGFGSCLSISVSMDSSIMPFNLAISADRKPSDTIFSINVFHLGKEPRNPFGLLRAEEFHIPRIKEKEKLVDLDAEKAGKDKMPEFMYDNQYRKGNDYLKYFY